jgi:hypothetical protein
METYNYLKQKQNLITHFIIATIILFSINCNISAQTNLVQEDKPINVTLEIVDFNQGLKSFDLISSFTSNKSISDFKYEIQTVSFVIPTNELNSIETEISAGQKIDISQSFVINKNSSFKIKTIYSGKEHPDSTDFCIVENYYFYYNGNAFETFKDPHEFITLKSGLINDNDIKVFNREETDTVIISLIDNNNLKSANEQQTTYNLTVSGNIKYRDRTNVAQNVRYATVKIYDNDAVGQNLLGTTATDENGNYSVSITSTDAGGPDIYIEVRTEGLDNFPSGSNGIANVRNDILSYYYVDTKDNIRENTTSDIQISVTISNTGPNAGARDVYDSFVEGWLKSKQYFDINIDKVPVFWPSSGTKQVTIIWIDYIQLLQLDRYDRDVILHEYGHYVNSKYDLINAVGGSHSWGQNLTNSYDRRTAVRLALSEGWATFYSIAIQFDTTNDRFYDDTEDYDIRDDLENNNYSGADNEAATCGILWDIFDSNNTEQHDNLTTPLSDIWRVLIYGEKIDSIHQFASKWQALNKGHLTELSNIYTYFGIDLGISPDVTILTVDGSAVNTSLTAGANHWYRFQTGTSGTYTIQTYGSTDTYMELYQNDQTTRITSDDDGGSGTNARISRALNANTWYYAKARGYSSSTTGSYSIDVKKSTTLDPPRNLAATAGVAEVNLSWDIPVSGTPAGYKVYQSTSENGTYSLIGSTTNRNGRVTNLTNGTRYWFYVTAIYSSVESSPSNKASAVPDAGTNTPVILTVDGSAVNATLTAGANHWYRFQTGTSGSYTIQTYGSTDTYIDLYQSDQSTLIISDDDGGSGTNSRISRALSANTWYYAKVRGYSSSTTGSYSIDVKGPGTLNPPRNLTATAGDRQISIRWEAPISGTPSGYKVYRATSENGTYTQLGDPIPGFNATIPNLTNGTRYWFYVKAVYSGGDSPASNKASTVPDAGTNTPVILTVDGSAVNATLTAGANHWYRFQTGTSGSYTIQTYGSTDTYIDLYQSDQSTLIISDDDGGSGTNSRISRALSANTWYYAKVRGYSSSTTGSYSIDVKGPGTLNPPRNLTATAGDRQISIRWEAPISGTPSGYKVYRATSENGTYTQLGDPIPGFNATIPNLTNGIRYWFYVKAVYSGGDSPSSNKTSAVPDGQQVVDLTVDGSAINVTLMAGADHWYRFQTGTSGTYTIQTYGSTDTYMDLYQSNQTTLITSDDDGGSGTNARISRTLSAGTWYYVKVRGYSSSTTGSYSIDVKGTVTLNPPAQPHCFCRR